MTVHSGPQKDEEALDSLLHCQPAGHGTEVGAYSGIQLPESSRAGVPAGREVNFCGAFADQLGPGSGARRDFFKLNRNLHRCELCAVAFQDFRDRISEKSRVGRGRKPLAAVVDQAISVCVSGCKQHWAEVLCSVVSVWLLIGVGSVGGCCRGAHLAACISCANSLSISV